MINFRGCLKCMIIYQKHYNVLQYREGKIYSYSQFPAKTPDLWSVLWSFVNFWWANNKLIAGPNLAVLHFSLSFTCQSNCLFCVLTLGDITKNHVIHYFSLVFCYSYSRLVEMVRASRLCMPHFSFFPKQNCPTV